ncbi:T9SS ring complex lipoprotein PorK/GldK [Alkalitalea saponilacus]|uniref:Gliding motility-associated lipoprotein GldK n=1 Tax=Alkalitalea saponilacus TaxID=889453 RepID=A0A1T5HMD6_9BACT|nr:SUMF1/EgtB/PvdO family nonheme iron enzyme [Alkalitalea saponilacus]ASB49398.1 gliding motility-associated lipoprotein [Alkalitalea saponilacus]SKC21833.1 gliding motility-associated lipoprotein GldK [Alkalitalea saponilacus]
MKKVLALCIIVLTILSGCGRSGNGELVGVPRRASFYEPEPYGMLFIPQGSFNMGLNDQDITGSLTTEVRTVSVPSFWMDETEITNTEYRQFVYWVRDSIARSMLGEQFDEFLITEDRFGNIIEPPFINWRTRLNWNNEEYAEILEDLFLPENERFFRRKEIDTRLLNYEYEWVDLQQAARRSNRFNFETNSYEGEVYNQFGERIEIADRSAFIMKDRVNVYPDTLVWIADFTYSFNEPMTEMYFWHPGFDEYPVVGVDWKQATAFCIWRTQLLNNFLRSKGQPEVMQYRLPSEAEWEYAARGGLNSNTYPWGGLYTRNDQGCFLANFKPLRGRYGDDGGMYTMQVGSFAPNDFGLYDMAGNVAEWTSSAFDESSYSFMHDMSPTYKYNALPGDHHVMKRKVVRGGSWKDIGFFLQNSTRTYEYQDSAKSYIGFRCVRDYIGN